MSKISRTIAVIFCALLPSLALAAPGSQKIPVYPGSVFDFDQSPNPQCCDFSTADNINKVAAFYEKALKTQALSIDDVVKKYPALSAKIVALKKEIPSGATYKALALPLAEGDMADAPRLLELFGMSGLVNFTIAPEALEGADAEFAAEFRRRTGKFTEDEKKDAERKEAEKIAKVKLAKEDKAWRKLIGVSGVPVFPDAAYLQSVGPTVVDGASPDKPIPMILGVYESYSLYDKIRDFYGVKLHPISEEAIASRREASPFRFVAEVGGRSYTSKSRAGTGRTYFTGPECIDVAIIEGRGGEGGQKITRIVFDLDSKCREAATLSGELWPK